MIYSELEKVSRIREVSKNSPENLLVYPNAHLLLAMEYNDYEEAQAAIGAELCIRYFLSGNADYLTELKEWNVLSQSETGEFRDHMPMVRDICFRQADIRGQDFWTPASSLSTKCLTFFRARIETLMRADGLIPVIDKGDRASAFFLPFLIEKDCPGCYDLDGRKHKEWSKYLLDMGLTDCRLELLVHLDGESSKLNPSGPSMMLPALMAWSHKHKTDGVTLPKYNPFRLVATGEFKNGCLKQVETGGKIKCAREILFEPTFVYPDDGSHAHDSDDRISFLRLPEGISMEEALEKIRGYLDRELTEFSNDYISKRYRDLWEEAKHHIYVDGEQLQAEFMENAVPNDATQSREYLLRCMLQSQLYYSIGDSRRALEKNREAIQFAKKNNFYEEILLLRLRLEQIEFLVGQERFDQVKELIREVTQGVKDSFSDHPDKNDTNPEPRIRTSDTNTAKSFVMKSGLAEMKDSEPGLSVQDLSVSLNGKVLLDHASFDIPANCGSKTLPVPSINWGMAPKSAVADTNRVKSQERQNLSRHRSSICRSCRQQSVQQDHVSEYNDVECDSEMDYSIVDTIKDHPVAFSLGAIMLAPFLMRTASILATGVSSIGAAVVKTAAVASGTATAVGEVAAFAFAGFAPVIVKRMAEFAKEQGYQLSQEDLEVFFQKTSRALSLQAFHVFGIAHACAACAGVEGFSREEAEKLFTEALKYAIPQSQSSQVELEEFSRAMNDIHWYYTLFEPGSNKEREKEKMATSQHLELKKNRNGVSALRHYDEDLKLSIFLAWYRSLLRDHAVPKEYEKRRKGLVLPVLKERPCEQALLAKYVGALEAASGRLDEARRLFHRALKTMPEGNDPKRLSIYLEAFRSLNDSSFLDSAREVDNRTLAKRNQVDSTECSPLPFWSGWLNDPSSEFPGLKYWY